MKKLAAALVALAVAAPAVAQIAPPVKRTPAAKAAAPANHAGHANHAAPAAPAAADPAVAPAATRAPAEPAPQATAGNNRARNFQTALAGGAEKSLDPIDASLIRVMGNLMAAGRCGEATALASRDGRSELAAKAKQLCK